MKITDTLILLYYIILLLIINNSIDDEISIENINTLCIQYHIENTNRQLMLIFILLLLQIINDMHT
jgi:hypothetical protein